MKKATASMLLAAGLAVISSVPAHAHHSFALFDMNKKVTLTGTVREFRFSSPHSYIEMTVPGKAGSTDWSVEMGATMHLVREGWNRATLKPGDKVTVVTSPLLSGANGGLFVSATLADGKRLGSGE